MARIRTGTVGYNYRDWRGIFYPASCQPRRQLSLYLQHFDVCELAQFTHQMPDPESAGALAAQLRGDSRVFVRIHNAMTHSADLGISLAVAKHFRKAMEPLIAAGKLAGFVAAFPYAFRNSAETQDYVLQLNSSLGAREFPLQLDFRHPSWSQEGSFEWIADHGMGFVCVDEPELPGLLSPHVTATAKQVLIRLHGRNAEGWWSGNPTSRHDYCYSVAELKGLLRRYAPLLERDFEVSFVFQNHWQAQAVKNAMQWKVLLADPAQQGTRSVSEHYEDDDASRPPTRLPLEEVKSRVTRALSDLNIPPQIAMNLMPRKD